MTKQRPCADLVASNLQTVWANTFPSQQANFALGAFWFSLVFGDGMVRVHCHLKPLGTTVPLKPPAPKPMLLKPPAGKCQLDTTKPAEPEPAEPAFSEPRIGRTNSGTGPTSSLSGKTRRHRPRCCQEESTRCGGGGTKRTDNFYHYCEWTKSCTISESLE